MAMRLDRDGRDVTGLPGLWDEGDVIVQERKPSKLERAAMNVLAMVQEHKLAVGGCVDELREALDDEIYTPLSSVWLPRAEKPTEAGWYWTFSGVKWFREQWYSLELGWAYVDFDYWFPERMLK